MPAFSDFVIYADESGDHSLVKIDRLYPVFVLSLCIFNKTTYVRRVVPQIHNLKFKWFGRDSTILHERDIRKQVGDFRILSKPDVRFDFMEDLNVTLKSASMAIVASVVDKRRLTEEYLFQDNPYGLALQFCLEGAFQYLAERKQTDRLTHCVFEKRGPKEDRELELEFLRITSGANRFRHRMGNFALEFVDKKANCPGLQIADLTARPIGLKILRPPQPNRAYDIIRPKLYAPKGTKGLQKRLRVFP